MCFLVNRPPAAGEKFSGSIVIVKPPARRAPSELVAAAGPCAGPMNAGYFRRVGPAGPAVLAG